jgi:hypothetical protein
LDKPALREATLRNIWKAQQEMVSTETSSTNWAPKRRRGLVLKEFQRELTATEATVEYVFTDDALLALTISHNSATVSKLGRRDTVEALVDGLEPKSSNDHSIPRFTWWDHRGSAEWVQYDFGKPRKVSSTQVYWFDDTGAGSCRVPSSWKLLYQEGEHWKPVETASEFGTRLDTYNRVEFKSIETTGLRLEVQLQPEFSGGILEWKVNP